VAHRLSHRSCLALVLALTSVSFVPACGNTSADGHGSSSGGSVSATGGGTGGAPEGTGGATGGTGGTTESEVTYLKASNTGAGDRFGVAVALSADGSTLAIGANREASSSTGVDGSEIDDSTVDAGAVYVFSRSGSSWEQVAYLKASNSGAGDGFGSTLAVSADGNTLAVGAPFEASAATGIDGDQNDDSALRSGAIYVFSRSGASWAQDAYLKGSNTDADDLFGVALALSADGAVLAVGAEGEDGSATGIEGDQTNKSASEAGAVYVFARSESAWQQRDYLKASNTEAFDHFGGSVALTADGSTLAVGAYWEDSAAGIDGDQSDNSAKSTGAAYVFVHDGSAWQQKAYLKPAEDGNGSDNFGTAVSLSADGHTLAVGAAGDPSAATGIDGDPADTSMPYAGAVYLFGSDGSAWQQEAYLKASNTGAGDEFGQHIHLSANGETLAAGAALEASRTSAAQDDDSAPEAGAVYVFGRDGTSWRQRAYIKAANADPSDRFGFSLALSPEGDTLVAGASRESSSATGIDGDQRSNSATSAGAVYVFGAATLAGP
jgi:hypothetical protein